MNLIDKNLKVPNKVHRVGYFTNNSLFQMSHFQSMKLVE